MKPDQITNQTKLEIIEELDPELYLIKIFITFLFIMCLHSGTHVP